MTLADMRKLSRKATPRVIGTLRVGCGAPALFAVHFQEEEFAATLITLGFITDGIDGPVARKLGVSSEFGASHDYFANYLCYIVAQKVI